jgi:hypothetical protein
MAVQLPGYEKAAIQLPTHLLTLAAPAMMET